MEERGFRVREICLALASRACGETLLPLTGSGPDDVFFSKVVKSNLKSKHIHCTSHLESLKMQLGFN